MLLRKTVHDVNHFSRWKKVFFFTFIMVLRIQVNKSEFFQEITILSFFKLFITFILNHNNGWMYKFICAYHTIRFGVSDLVQSIWHLPRSFVIKGEKYFIFTQVNIWLKYHPNTGSEENRHHWSLVQMYSHWILTTMWDKFYLYYLLFITDISEKQTTLSRFYSYWL